MYNAYGRRDRRHNLVGIGPALRHIAQNVGPVIQYMNRNMSKNWRYGAAVSGAAAYGYQRYSKNGYKPAYNKRPPRTYKPAGRGGVISGYAKKRSYRRKRRGRGVPRSFKKYVNRISQAKDDNLAVNVFRDIDSGNLTVEENQCSYTTFGFLLQDDIEDALDGMQIIDVVGGNATKTAMNPLTADSVHCRILNAKLIFDIRNNGATPCYLEVYWLFPKRRTAAATTPLTIFENGLENRGVTTNELTDLRFNIRDSPAFRKYFKVYKFRKFLVNAGDELQIVMNRKKPFTYRPDEFDDHTNSVSLPNHSQHIVFRMKGVVSHDDTTPTLVGTCDSTLDYVRTRHIKFSSNVNLKHNYLTTGSKSLDTQSAGSKVYIDSVDEVGETL